MEEKNNIEWGATKIMLDGREIKGISSIEYKEPPALVPHSDAIDAVAMGLYARGQLPGFITVDDLMSGTKSYGATLWGELARSFSKLTASMTISKRAMRKLLKSMPRAKKVRLPRKQKKALKKAWRKLDTDTFVKLLPKEANYITCSPMKTKDPSSIYSIKL